MRTAVFAVPFLLLVSSCVIDFGNWSPSHWSRDSESFEVDRADLQSVACTTHNGEVTVTGSESADKIVVHVDRRAGAWSQAEAADALRNIEILHKRVDGGLSLGWRWRRNPPNRWSAVVSFRVEQPRDLPATAISHNGDVTCAGLRAGVTVRSHNGDVTVTDAAGSLAATTWNGTVRASATSGSVAVSSHNGDVRVSLQADGAVDGSIGTHNGSVHLALAGEPSTKLVCTSHNGRVRADRRFENVAAARSSLSGVLGKGEGKLLVHTHNGSIRVE